jgi:protein TonB
VVVRAIIGPEGTVLDASVHSSSDVNALDDAAVEAVTKWRFRPAKRGGSPVAAEVLIPLRFDCQ